MLTCSFVCTEGTRSAIRSVSNTSFPHMRLAIWALITAPPHLSVTVRLDQDVVKMHILDMMPLALQHWAEQADVWALPLADACVLIWGVGLMKPVLMA